MKPFESSSDMLDYGKGTDGPLCALAISSTGEITAYTMTPNPAPAYCGIGYSYLGIWTAA